MPQRTGRTPDELEVAAGYVAEEWRLVAGIAQRLEVVEGARTPSESADLDAGVLRYRAIVNFCCGNYHGKWWPMDIAPEDFVGRLWWPGTEAEDRELRGRLPGINKALAHLSWERLDLHLLWPFGLLAHEADWALRQFLAEVPRDAPWASPLQDAAEFASYTLPAKKSWASTSVDPAPAR